MIQSQRPMRLPLLVLILLLAGCDGSGSDLAPLLEATPVPAELNPTPVDPRPKATVPMRPLAVIAVLAEAGVDPTHREFRLPLGVELILPDAVKAVPVDLPPANDPNPRATLQKGLLGHMANGTLYHVRGTRLLIYNGTDSSDDDLFADAFHGTGTASLAAGATVGTAPDALVVVVLDSTNRSWAWASRQTWIDVVTSSVLSPAGSGEISGTSGLDSFSTTCDGQAGAKALAAAGVPAFAAAGNAFLDSTVYAPASDPSVIRVGGVRPDGSTALPTAGNPTDYSARAYEVAELWRNRIALAGTTDRYQDASGTSGSSPRLAGRVARMIATLRGVVGDARTGARNGVLVIAAPGRAPKSGPLADGRLDRKELLDAVLHAARPSAADARGRYALEGFGFFDQKAQNLATDVLLGRAALPARAEDNAAFSASQAAELAMTTARGCAVTH